jgi:hypothetical protein
MKRIFAVISAFALFELFRFGSATAEEIGATHPVCTTQGSGNARILSFDLRDRTVLSGMRYSILLAPPTRALDRNSCIRAEFAANGETFFLGGDNDGSIVRFGISRTPFKTLIVLESLPLPDVALKWLHDNPASNRASFPLKGLMYGLQLVSREPKQISYLRFYDRIPDDRDLLQTMCDVLSGTMPPVFTIGKGLPFPEILPIRHPSSTKHADCHVKFAMAQP